MKRRLYLALDVYTACSILGCLEDVASFAGEEANIAIAFLDQMLSACVADELNTLACASVWVFGSAMIRELLDKEANAYVWLVAASESACTQGLVE